MAKPSVRLLTAYCWTCPKCKNKNFCDAKEYVPEDEAERIQRYREFHDLEDWQPLPLGWQHFKIVTWQNSVICDLCSEEFETSEEGV